MERPLDQPNTGVMACWRKEDRDDLAPMIREIGLSSGMRNRETDDSPVSFPIFDKEE